MPANISALSRRQAYFLSLAEKNRERAAGATDPGLLDDYARLAEGYEEAARTLGEVNRYVRGSLIERTSGTTLIRSSGQ